MRICATLKMTLELRSIALYNFKSYKGHHVINNIDKSFTAIVGPNGSGKSNIIDSILFVLGFRAKKMRHNQITDLIYNDGVKQKSCYVELEFNKFKIKREVHSNKNSTYYCNGIEISNGELVRTMMNEDVDMEHNRFLILQGEIESIAMLSPKEGLLEFLEDIIGSSKYKNEIEHETNVVKREEERNANLSSTLKFIKNEYDHINEITNVNADNVLKKVKTKKLEKEYKNLLVEKISRTIIRYEEEMNKLNHEILKTKNHNSENKGLLQTLENELQIIRNMLKDKEIEFLETKKKVKKMDRNNTLQSEYKTKLEKELIRLDGEIKSRKFKSKMKTEENKILKNEYEHNNSELCKLNEKMKALQTSLKKEQMKVNDAKKFELQAMQINENKLVDLINKKSQQDELNLQIQLEIKYAEERRNSLVIQIDEIKSKLVVCDNYAHLNRNKIESELHELVGDMQKTQKELDKRKIRYNEVAQRQENDKKAFEILNVLKSIKGVHGRLKDVGEIDVKYSLALKTSCNRLNNIIVDTTQTAEKCIELIKKNNLPRSTFIILEKITDVPVLEKDELPYIYELVACDKIYKKCFYFALSTTLVSNTLENARRVAFGKQRKRVVTLDGKIIEKSGVMTGGRYHENVKKYEEIEAAMAKMTKLKAKKNEELQGCIDYENNKNMLTVCAGKEKELQATEHKLIQLKSHNAMHSYEEDISMLKDTIAKIKHELDKMFDPILKKELNIVSDQIEMIEKRNQDLCISLNEKMLPVSDLEEELLHKQRKLDEIHIVDISEMKSEMATKEELYKEILDDFNKMQENVLDLKKKMGTEYHVEMELRSKLEDVENKHVSTKVKLDTEMTMSDNISKELHDLQAVVEKYACIFARQAKGDILQEHDKMLCSNTTNKHVSKGRKMKSEYSISTEETDLGSITDGDLNDYIQQISNKLNNTKESTEVNFLIFDEYDKVTNEYKKAALEYETHVQKIEKLKNKIETLKKERYTIFTEGLRKVNIHLKEIYKKLTFGGNAELEMIDYLDPFSDGIRLAIMPPKKCWKNVINLSGGEKTLSSLSLIFALHKFKPSPFYVMDEIDAALDYRNVSIISEYIKEMAKTSQFLVISLRNDMFELSNSILGVYKVNSVSKFLMVNVDEFKKKLRV